MLNFIKSLFGNAKQEQIRAARAAGAVIIDVRTPGEFAVGHMAGAVNMPLDQLPSKLPTIRAYKKPIILCCASGVRSGRARTLLVSEGIADVHNAGSWRKLL